jgi:cysteine-rich repeat protein/probable HAF family extracellular repeat protein
MARISGIAIVLLLVFARGRAVADIAYHLVDLGTLGGTDSYSWGMNGAGDVVGVAANDVSDAGGSISCGVGVHVTTQRRAFLYTGGLMQDLGTLGGANSAAIAINTAGEIVGYADTPTSTGAFLFAAGHMVDLGLDQAYPYAIDAAGDFVAYGAPNIVYSAGTVTPLANLPGGFNNVPVGIDDMGQVGGWADDGMNQHAVVWQGGVPTRLFPSEVNNNHVWAVAPSGKLVVDLYPGPQAPGFYILDGATLTYLGFDPGQSIPQAVSDTGVVVGYGYNGTRAFVYRGGVLTDLNTLVRPSSTLELRDARAVNAAGQIAACAWNGAHGHAVRLDPFDPALCGNGTVDPGEDCDDGNTTNGDGCDTTCLVEPTCGDGIRQRGEECDDGNMDDGDGCDHNCTFTGCGNGIVTLGEQCDDGAQASGDGCSAACLLEECGNGFRDFNEQCDDGNLVDGDGCDHNCTPTACGNGVVTAGEACDDGNMTAGDGCSPSCAVERCGNAFVDGGEECDDGNGVSGDGCDADCTVSACGNGVVAGAEECDDGNTQNGDGCSATCTLESPALCGNAVVGSGEQCDDGNHVAGDGCSATCQLEGYPDITGSWQVTFDYGVGATSKFLTVTDQDPVTGYFHAMLGFQCGTDQINGFVYANATCTLAPAVITGRFRGPTRIDLPFSGAFAIDSVRADPADAFTCHPLTRTVLDFDATGAVTADATHTVQEVRGSAFSNVALYSGQTNCFSAGAGPAFVMLRNDVAVGSDVIVQPRETASVSFETVSATGQAGVIPLSTPTGSLPAGFQLSGQVPYTEVVTNAGVSGVITTCLPYPDADDDGFVDGTNPPMPEGDLQILHVESGVFVDRTVSRDPVANVICAETTSLSEFALGVGPSTTTTTTTPTTSTTSTTLPPSCTPTALGACHHAVPTKSVLALTAGSTPARNKLGWKWAGIDPLTTNDFGSPSTTTGYALCVYDQRGLVLAVSAASGGVCAGKPCWTEGPRGVIYKNADVAANALAKMTLRPGLAGHAKFAAKAKGSRLALTSLPLLSPVKVQLQRDDAAVCWDADYDAAIVDTGVRFKAKSN